MKLTEIFDAILESTGGKIKDYAFYVGNAYKDEAKEINQYKGINVYTHLYLLETEVIWYGPNIIDEEMNLN